MMTIELIEQPSIAELEAEIRTTEEAGVAAIRQWVERAWKAEASIAELEAQIRDAGDYTEKLQIECGELEARLAEAKTQADTMRRNVQSVIKRAEKAEAALRAVEWVSGGDGWLECAWCGMPQYDALEHKPDCARQAALSHAEQDGKEGE